MNQTVRDSIHALLAEAAEPMTTSQISEALRIREIVCDIYSILIPMQCAGLVQRNASSPWTWSAARQSMSSNEIPW